MRRKARPSGELEGVSLLELDKLKDFRCDEKETRSAGVTFSCEKVTKKHQGFRPLNDGNGLGC